MRRLSLLPQLLAASVMAGSLFLCPASMAEVQKTPRATIEDVREARLGKFLGGLIEMLIKPFKILPPVLQIIIIAGSGSVIVLGPAISMLSDKSSGQEERSEDKNQDS